MKRDMEIAYQNKNFFVKKNPVKNRVTVYFSANKTFLWKVVLSTIDGAVITVYPITTPDVEYAKEQGIIRKDYIGKKELINNNN